MKLKKGLLIFLAMASSSCTLTVSRDGTRAYGLNLVQAAEGISALATGKNWEHSQSKTE